MSLIGTIATGLNVSEGIVKLVGGAIGLVGGALLLWAIVDAIGDGRENKLRLDAAEEALENQGVADSADSAQAAADDAADDELEEAIDEAASNDPEGAAGATGPVTNAVADSLRESRAAGQREPGSD